MFDCKICEHPNLCLGVREAKDYISSDGELHQIIGCTTDEFIYGDILTDADIEDIKRQLEGSDE